MRTEIKSLSKAEIDARLKAFQHWNYIDQALERSFQFSNFSEAFAFMVRVAFVAESLNHHPDWTNVYNQVTIRLNTHDVQGITDRDFDLARQIDLIHPR